MHQGYCISCYGKKSYVFSAPISASSEEVQLILRRKSVINGEPLTHQQLKKLQPYLIGEVEIGWDDNLAFYLEGQNLPED